MIKINNLVRELQEIKAEYPAMTNDEILKVMELSILQDIKQVLNK